MGLRGFGALVAAAALAVSGAALAYPGGTPTYQTDITPSCAACHSSRSEDYLSGAGERARKETVENKHLAVIKSGQKGYGELSEADRGLLIERIRALDEASTVSLDAPERVAPGASFQVTVRVTGGAGPVVGVALVDRAHRWYARPAPSAGWQIAAPPVITGPDGEPQDGWLAKRPADAGRNLSFVNVTGIRSDSDKQEWAQAQVVFTLRAPPTPGSYPLAAAYLYGSEKSTRLGYTKDALGRQRPRGGLAGASGRILFTPVEEIRVE